VLNIYLTDKAPDHARPLETKQRVMTLADYCEGKTLADVNGQFCRNYVKQRVDKPWKSARPEDTGNKPRLVTEAAARRELEDLRSAINHHRQEGYCSEIVPVVLPKKAPAREGFLTESDAARIIWAAWRAKQVMRDKKTKRDVGKHIARFMLVALYTGSRSGAVAGASFVPAIGRGHIDTENGLFFRRAQGARITKKRQPPVKLSERLLLHLRRWERLGISKLAVIQWNGKPFKSIRKGFAAAVKASGVEKGYPITPHLLRHTAATWLVQRGVSTWDAAGLLGMSPEMIERVYGHHHPDFQANAAAALSGQKRDRNPVNKPRRATMNETNIAVISRKAQ
jgi:integrase